MAYLASDNTAAVHPAVLEALATVNQHHAKSYGADEITMQMNQKFREVFHCPHLLAYPVFNGSAANCLGLAAIMRPFEAVITHSQSHLQQDECGMPEFFTGGKILVAEGVNGKVTPESVQRIVDVAKAHGVHHSRPRVISIAQSTESGTIYTPEEIRALSHVAKQHGLLLHMDGARFANAVASLGCSPADITWKAGVDVMSFGATKNGAMLAEAIVFFHPETAPDFEPMRKRAGQLASKQRYISAQLLAMFNNDLWLKNAAHANDMAARLAGGLANISAVKCVYTPQANALFVQMPQAMVRQLWDKGHYFYDWPLPEGDVYRLVTGFTTTEEEIDQFVADALLAAEA